MEAEAKIAQATKDAGALLAKQAEDAIKIIASAAAEALKVQNVKIAKQAMISKSTNDNCL